MSEISATEQPNLHKIDITKLNLQQLTQLKQQLDHELNVFQESLQTLKIAQGRFQDSGLCLEKISPEAEGKEILVPLTGSMYVSGKLSGTNNVMVDIGTGYYAQKSVADARDYFKRRVTYVTEQMEKIQQIGIEKNKIREATIEVMQLKLQNQIPSEVVESV